MIIGKPKTLRQNNKKIILDFIRSSGEISISDISDKIKLSKTTIARIIEHFLIENLVVSSGKGDSTVEGGKKPELFKFNQYYKLVIGIHIFHDELYATLFDLKLNMLKDFSIPLNENENLDRVINTIYDAYQILIKDYPHDSDILIGIAIGIHGITNEHTGVVNISPHFPSWGENIQFKFLLKKKLQKNIPLFLDNQMRLQVFAEKYKGIASNYRNIMVIEGGYGLVAGIIIKNELLRGKHYLAGEIGHMILDTHDQELCVCGGKGCFEVLVSIKRLMENTYKSVTEYPDSFLSDKINKKSLQIEDIFIAANLKDLLACYLMDQVIDWFAVALSNLVLVLDPEIIVIQGIYVKAGDYFITNLRKKVNKISLLRIDKKIRIEYSNFGKERGVTGGAAYLISDYFNNSNLYK